MTSSLALMFLATTSALQLPPGLLASVCFIESSHRPTVITKNDGGSASVGICQIKLKTAEFLGFSGSEQELLKPKTNIYWAGKYLAYQLKRYHGNVKRAVCAYNRGTSQGNGHNKYTRKVFSHWYRTGYKKWCNYPRRGHQTARR